MKLRKARSRFGKIPRFLYLLRLALKDNPKGAIKSLIGLILLIVLLIVTYNIGSSETVIMGGGTEYTNVTMLKVTDMLLYSTYVLFGLAAIGTLINLSGILKK